MPPSHSSPNKKTERETDQNENEEFDHSRSEYEARMWTDAYVWFLLLVKAYMSEDKVGEDKIAKAKETQTTLRCILKDDPTWMVGKLQETRLRDWLWERIEGGQEAMDIHWQRSDMDRINYVEFHELGMGFCVDVVKVLLKDPAGPYAHLQQPNRTGVLNGEAVSQFKERLEKESPDGEWDVLFNVAWH